METAAPTARNIESSGTCPPQPRVNRQARSARCAICCLPCCKSTNATVRSRPTRGSCIYELVQRGQFSKVRTGARRTDQNLHDALIDIREDGRIPWDWIVDETRSVEDYTGYRSIKQGVLARLPYTDLDPWRGRAPLILTESRSLAGVLRPIVIEHCDRIAPTNGQCGGFLRTDIAPLLQPGDERGLSRRSTTSLAVRSRPTPGAFLNRRSAVNCAGSGWR